MLLIFSKHVKANTAQIKRETRRASGAKVRNGSIGEAGDNDDNQVKTINIKCQKKSIKKYVCQQKKNRKVGVSKAVATQENQLAQPKALLIKELKLIT